jgi:hypothetical protein
MGNGKVTIWADGNPTYPAGTEPWAGAAVNVTPEPLQYFTPDSQVAAQHINYLLNRVTKETDRGLAAIDPGVLAWVKGAKISGSYSTAVPFIPAWHPGRRRWIAMCRYTGGGGAGSVTEYLPSGASSAWVEAITLGSPDPSTMLPGHGADRHKALFACTGSKDLKVLNATNTAYSTLSNVTTDNVAGPGAGLYSTILGKHVLALTTSALKLSIVEVAADFSSATEAHYSAAGTGVNHVGLPRTFIAEGNGVIIAVSTLRTAGGSPGHRVARYSGGAWSSGLYQFGTSALWAPVGLSYNSDYGYFVLAAVDNGDTSSKIRILVSDDGSSWTPVYTVTLANTLPTFASDTAANLVTQVVAFRGALVGVLRYAVASSTTEAYEALIYSTDLGATWRDVPGLVHTITVAQGGTVLATSPLGILAARQPALGGYGTDVEFTWSSPAGLPADVNA